MNAREITELAIGVYGAMQKPEEFKRLIELCLEKPHETVLEIGSGRGGTLWAWSHLPNNRTTISVDLPGGEFGGGLLPEDRERIENWIDPKQNTFLCAMDSHNPATLKEVYETLWSLKALKEGFCSNIDTLVDILMIDGDHTYDGVKKDFEMYSPLVKPGGLIVFHDICDHSTTAPTCQVMDFWVNLTLNKMYGERKYYEFISAPATWGGIGVLIA